MRPCSSNILLRFSRVSQLHHRVSHSLLFRRATSSGSKRCVSQILQLAPEAQGGQEIHLDAFVRSVRKQKRKAFAAIDDGSSLVPLQAVLEPEQAQQLTTGTAVSLSGRWVASKNASQQAAELQVDKVTILGDNEIEVWTPLEIHLPGTLTQLLQTNPVQKKYQTPEFLRTVPHLRSRIPFNAILLRLRSSMIASATRFFEERDFVQAHTPVITSSDCEGAGEVFQVAEQSSGVTKPGSTKSEDYFGAPKYLSVSSQLHLEALAQAVRRAWTLSPTFRAEKSDTARHLSEFYMLEAEECFIYELDDVMGLVEALIRSMAQDLVASRVGKDLQHWYRQHREEEGQVIEVVDVAERWKSLLSSDPYPQVTYHQAVEVLQRDVADGKVSFDVQVHATSGLQTEHERYLAEKVGKGSPLFVTNYPKNIKPFYMSASETHEGSSLGQAATVACFDLLLPEVCEVVGGSMREHRLDVLEAEMRMKGLLKTSDKGAMDWYLDLRRYGSVPHGGFGLGFDRLLAYLAGVKNIRDIVTFPRWYGRCSC